MSGVNPRGDVDVSGTFAIRDPISIVGTILLVEITDSVEELVMNAADCHAPVRKSQRLPSVRDSIPVFSLAA